MQQPVPINGGTAMLDLWGTENSRGHPEILSSSFEIALLHIYGSLTVATITYNGVEEIS